VRGEDCGGVDLDQLMLGADTRNCYRYGSVAANTVACDLEVLSTVVLIVHVSIALISSLEIPGRMLQDELQQENARPGNPGIMCSGPADRLTMVNTIRLDEMVVSAFVPPRRRLKCHPIPGSCITLAFSNQPRHDNLEFIPLTEIHLTPPICLQKRIGMGEGLPPSK
jgi:hypothetical protein